MVPMTWISGKALSMSWIFIPGAVSIPRAVWVSGERGLHAAYDLDIEQNAVSMLSVSWVSEKRPRHDVYGLSLG
jgi:hypothetical protein